MGHVFPFLMVDRLDESNAATDQKIFTVVSAGRCSRYVLPPSRYSPFECCVHTRCTTAPATQQLLTASSRLDAAPVDMSPARCSRLLRAWLRPCESAVHWRLVYLGGSGRVRRMTHARGR